MPRINKVLIAISSLGVLCGIVYASWKNVQKSTETEASAVEMPPFSSPKLMGNNQTKTIQTAQISPDGQVELLAKTEEKSSTEKSVSLKIQDKEKNEELEVYSFALDNASSVNIPFNTWSPDKNLFFVEKLEDDKRQYLLMKAQSLQNEAEVIDISQHFIDTKLPYTLDRVTGWAAPKLLIVTTTKDDEKKGPSFWFDCTTQRFIQLSSRF